MKTRVGLGIANGNVNDANSREFVESVTPGVSQTRPATGW